MRQAMIGCLPNDLLHGYNNGMAKSARRNQKPNPDEEPSEIGGSSFAWEFVNDEQAGGHSTAIPRAVDGQAVRSARREPRVRQGASARSGSRPPLHRTTSRPGPARARDVRDRLDRALERWWASGELPTLELLRDGLLFLEAGGDASESQRTLLLRTALAYNRGLQTALRHQTDPERVALVLAEALVEWEAPVAPEQISSILQHNEQVRSLLVAELERSRILQTGELRLRAQEALEFFARETPSGIGPPKTPQTPTTSTAHRRPIRQVILFLLLALMLGFVFWQQRQVAPKGMIAMPGATYAMLPATRDAPVGSVTLEPFFIDQFEVTNREYRVCVERGGCEWPVAIHSATRRDYFTNPAFNDYPVVNVTQKMAADYCHWQEKRLPSAAEWQAAASVSPTTGQAYPYPWGATFEAQRTNSLHSGQGDTVVVGSFRPAGDSPSGVADMAGNVAEWTATEAPGSEQRPQAIVKGGSFLSDEAGLTVGAEMYVDVTSASPDIGFRCARYSLRPPS